ncbi:hypothetical protein Scani_25550 [Streptomyces caniferus]|uniref:Uncharacterized protein n=1 Tax=Streptomyces caniferus TaxID=285557 RepID=A0A640S5J0_9ACTN|nr:hypothetical protein Scani_25550 [Streptomyces caniferus]
MRCIARRRDVRILGVSGCSDNAARCRSCRRAPARDYGTALSRAEQAQQACAVSACPGHEGLLSLEGTEVDGVKAVAGGSALPPTAWAHLLSMGTKYRQEQQT